MCKEQPMREEEYKGYAIKIYQDIDGPDPRADFDHIATMVCFHPNYNLGDKNDFSKEDLVEYVKRKDVLSLPLYLLDHSGLWLSTDRYACDPGGWDTSFIGYIVIDYATIRKEYSVKHVTKSVKERAYKLMQAEVEEYSAYLSGDVFGYVIEDPFGDEVDSCWGYIGWDLSGKDMLKECEAIIDHHITKQSEEEVEMHKEEIGEEYSMNFGC